MLNHNNFDFTKTLILFGFICIFAFTWQISFVSMASTHNTSLIKDDNYWTRQNLAQTQNKDNKLKRDDTKNVSIDASTDTESDVKTDRKVSFTPVYVSYAVAGLILLAAVGHIAYLHKASPSHNSSLSSNDIPLQSHHSNADADSVISTGMLAFRNIQL